MHPDIEKDMTERLSVEVQTFIDNLAAAGFKVDDLDLIVTFRYALEGELREEQRRVRVPEGEPLIEEPPKSKDRLWVRALEELGLKRPDE